VLALLFSQFVCITPAVSMQMVAVFKQYEVAGGCSSLVPRLRCIVILCW